MVKVNWTKQAVQDVDKIADFISKDSEHYAKIQFKGFLP